MTPPKPGDWYRHLTDFDRCVVVMRVTPLGVMVRNERGKVETINHAAWKKSFYQSK